MKKANSKSSHIQIRVSNAQKKAIQKAAKAANMDMSTYILARVSPNSENQFHQLLKDLQKSSQPSFAFAELNTFLSKLSKHALKEAVISFPAIKLDMFQGNYVAAMVEYACVKNNVTPPVWCSKFKGLEQPKFASKLQSLRLHLLKSSPPPFKKRNIFIDTTVGGQV